MSTSRRFDELPGWAFTVDERSMGIYEAIGTHPSGASTQAIGTDPDELMAQCKSDALRMQAQLDAMRDGPDRGRPGSLS